MFNATRTLARCLPRRIAGPSESDGCCIGRLPFALVDFDGVVWSTGVSVGIGVVGREAREGRALSVLSCAASAASWPQLSQHSPVGAVMIV